MVENQEQERQYNGEDLVRINTEQTSAVDVLRNTINGLKRLPFFPKAVVIAFKEVPSRISQTFEKLVEDAQKLETQRTAVDNTNSGDQGAPATEKSQGDSTDEQKDKDQDGPSAGSLPVVDQRVINNAVAQAQAITDGAAPADSIVGSTNGTTQKDNSDADQNANTIGTKKIPVIEANNLRDLLGFLASLINSSEDNSKNSTDKVNSTVFPAATIVTPGKGDASAVVSEDTDQAKLEESIKRYGDLMRFNTWDDYYKSFPDEEIRELYKQGKSVLSEYDFTNIKLKQFQLSLSIAKASKNNLEEQAGSLERENEEINGNLYSIENEREGIHVRLSALQKEEEELNGRKTEVSDKLEACRNNISELDTKIEGLEAWINELGKGSETVKKEAEKINQQRQQQVAQQGDTTATNSSSGDESLDSLLVSGMNNMGVSQEKTTGLLEENDALLKGKTSVSTERSDAGEEVAPVTSEAIPQNGNDAWKTGSEALQKNGNTGIDYMGLTPRARAEVGLKAYEKSQQDGIEYSDALVQVRTEYDDKNLDMFAEREREINANPNLSDEEKNAQKAVLWTELDNFVDENYIGSNAKGRTR